MKCNAVLAILVIAIFAAGAAACAKTDFTGTWKLDKSQSEGLPPGMDQAMTIKQTAERVDVEITIVSEQGSDTAQDSYVFDGKQNDITIILPNGDVGKGKRISKWSDDENSFDSSEEIAIEMPDGGTMTIKVLKHWTLSADGKTLTIEQTQETRRGVRKLKRVFTKQ